MPNTARRRILIVEDSRGDVFLVREAIECAGVEAEIDIVRDGHAATQYFDAADAVAANDQDRCPDLILLDMNLPKKSGDEVLKHLRASAHCRAAKVLIVTSSDAAQDRAMVQRLNLSGYFKKPSNYADFMRLGTIIRDLLKSAESR